MQGIKEIIVVGLISGTAGVVLTFLWNKFRKDSALYDAEQIKRDASKEAEHIQREAKVSAKTELIKIREEFEEEMKLRRHEQLNNEKRLSQRDDNLERKADVLDSKMSKLNVKRRI